MAGNDREPIGRKGKPTRPVKQKVSRRRYEDDDDYDDYDDYEDDIKIEKSVAKYLAFVKSKRNSIHYLV